MKIEERFPTKVGESIEVDGCRYSLYRGDEMDGEDTDRLPAYCVFEVECSSALRRGTHFYDQNYGRKQNDVAKLTPQIQRWFLDQVGDSSMEEQFAEAQAGQ